MAEISENTRKQMGAVKSLVNVYDLLNVGSFQGNFSIRLAEAQKFVKALHEQMFNDLQSQDDYEALLEEISEQEKAAKNEQK